MFGLDGFQPWTGVDDKYASSSPRVMVIGEVQVDAPLTDRESILGKLRAPRHLAFTNFDQAVLGKRHWEPGYREAVRDLWERTLFYNYVTTYVPRKAGTPLTPAIRLDSRHARLLRDMLATYKPTHAIVWGYDNWRTMAVDGADWEDEAQLRCGDIDEPYRGVVVDGTRTLFTRTGHPSAGFVYERWSLLLRRFLELKP